MRKHKGVVLAIFCFFGASSASTESYKTLFISMPLRAEELKPLLRCNWSKEFPADMVCEMYVPTSYDNASAIMALRPTVWTESEWKHILEMKRLEDKK